MLCIYIRMTRKSNSLLCVFCAMYYHICIYPVEIGVQISWNKKPMKRLCWFDVTISFVVDCAGNGLSRWHCLMLRIYFTYGIRAHNMNPVKICFAFACKIMIQWGDNFAHVTAAKLLWHVQIYHLIKSLQWKLAGATFFFTKFELWAQKTFVDWVVGLCMSI